MDRLAFALPCLGVSWSDFLSGHTYFFPEVKHCIPQEPICFGLITGAIRLKPRNHVGIKTHGFCQV
jgi:hypothetical protein